MTQVVVCMATYHAVGNFRWCKISWKCIQILQKKFSRCLFLWNGCSDHTPTSWRPRSICKTKKRYWMMQRRSKFVQQQLSLPFYVEAFRIRKVSKLPLWARNWLIGLSTVDLDFKASLMGLLAICIVAGWYFSTAAILEGRQTVENHLVHMGTSSYWCTEIHQFPSSFFRGFYFHRSRSVCKKIWKFAPSENFPLYGRPYS